MNRRDFVEVSLGAMGTLAWVGCASLQTVPVSPEGGIVRLAVRNYPTLVESGGWLKILPDGRPEPLYVLAVPSGYVVLSPICTHQGCTVGVEGAHLVCPCHGSTYTRDGAVVKGPAEQPLARVPATLTDGILAIDLRENG
jgi:Rieske Fe-S protein